MLFSFGLLVSNCVRRLVRCPTCRSQEGWGRCKVLETLSSSLQSLGILPYTSTSPPSPLLVNAYIQAFLNGPILGFECIVLELKQI